MHEIPCQEHSARIYLLQLAYMMSWNGIKRRPWFSKPTAHAHQAPATIENAFLQAQVDLQQQFSMIWTSQGAGSP